MKTSCLRLKLVELNFFASFNADDQRKIAFLTYLKPKKKPKKNKKLPVQENLSCLENDKDFVILGAKHGSKDFVMLGPKPQDMTALSIDYVIKI